VSFAVLEHVGSREHQRRFLAETRRVARGFVAYTPYRFFPVEMHTFIPLTHWGPTPWYRALWRRWGLTFRADEGNLNLLWLGDARRVLPKGSEVRLVWNLGWPSNIEIVWGDPRTSGVPSVSDRGPLRGRR